MTTASHPRRRTPWGDARFFIGIALVVASVVGVWAVVTGARQTAPVFVAARTIVPGDVVGASDLREIEVALGAVRAAYVDPDSLVEGSVAVRTVAEGEFVPADALADSAAPAVTTVVVTSTTAVPASVERGTIVELWSAPPREDGGFDTPAILVADATIAAVGVDDGMIGGGAVSLEVVIPRADVARTLQAVADGAALSVVPTAGPR